MTQQNIQTTNTALEQFKRIMLERRGFKQTQQTQAQAPKPVAKTMRDARHELDAWKAAARKRQPPRRGTPLGEKSLKAMEFIKSEKALGNERPISKFIAVAFGIDDAWARELIRREFGYCQKRNWNTDTPKVGTIARHDKVRAYLAEQTVRPTLAAISIMFGVGHASAMKLIHERFGAMPPKPPKEPQPARPMAHLVRAEAAREWLATQTERPSSVRTFRAQFHIGYEPAIRLLNERFGEVAK